MNKKIIVLLLACLVILGCKEMPAPKADDTGATAEGIASVVEANNRFAFEFYEQIDSEDNVFFSPYSISVAFAMLYEGANGQTAEEIKDVFQYPEDDLTRRSSFASIYNEINKRDKEYKLSTANALWAQKDYQFLQSYLDTIKNRYGGNTTNLDFVRETEKSRQTINNWVEERTNDKIKDIIPPGVLNDMTRLVLTNAIYFKGDWVIKFDKKRTSKQDFKITEDNVVQVDMMAMTGEKARFNYTETEDLQILELPYKGKEISMLVLLPKENLDNVSLDAEKLAEYRNNLQERDINVYLPKFTFETKTDLNKILIDMGMPTAFSLDADLSGMDGTQNLFVTKAIHQAFVEVNEEGTEAAAATAIVVGFKGIMTNEFRADHPFMFIIQQRDTGNILFMGKVVDPR
jgi:serpin B